MAPEAEAAAGGIGGGKPGDLEEAKEEAAAAPGGIVASTLRCVRRAGGLSY